MHTKKHTFPTVIIILNNKHVIDKEFHIYDKVPRNRLSKAADM